MRDWEQSLPVASMDISLLRKLGPCLKPGSIFWGDKGDDLTHQAPTLLLKVLFPLSPLMFSLISFQVAFRLDFEFSKLIFLPGMEIYLIANR